MSGSLTPHKKAKMEDMYETNSDVGQITAEDFQAMQDVMTFSAAVAANGVASGPTSPEIHRSDCEPSVNLSPTAFNSETLQVKTIVLAGSVSPMEVIWAGSPIQTVPTSMSPNMKRPTKISKRKYMKSNSTYLKMLTTPSIHE